MASIPSDTVELGSAAASTTGSDNGHPVPVPFILEGAPAAQDSWLHEAWLSTVNRYEQIATSMLGHDRLRQRTNKLPTLNTTADFLYTFREDGTPSTCRPKSPTWPMTKDEASRARVFVA